MNLAAVVVVDVAATTKLSAEQNWVWVEGEGLRLHFPSRPIRPCAHGRRYWQHSSHHSHLSNQCKSVNKTLFNGYENWSKGCKTT